MQISSYFDSGSIETVSARDPEDIQLRLRPDSSSDVLQWFHFRLTGAQDTPVRLCILNAEDATFNDWEGYRAFASYDTEDWFRVPTHSEKGELRIEHTPERNSVFYAYFQPYPHQRHARFIHQAQAFSDCRIEVLGQSVDGRDLDLLVLGDDDPEKRRIWFTARQHPGEPQAEWFAEGLVEELLNPQNALSRALLDQAVFYIAPNMNPDGAMRGNQRTNAAGSNLNRVWEDPSRRHEPEVYWVRRRILETGADLFFDIHGEEEIPYVFLCGSEGNTSYSGRQEIWENRFSEFLLEASRDFQTGEGYGKDQRGEANLSLASNWAADAFDCLGMTLEMPFKDNLGNPVPETGWTGARSKQLAGEFLEAVNRFLDSLKGAP